MGHCHPVAQRATTKTKQQLEPQINLNLQRRSSSSCRLERSSRRHTTSCSSIDAPSPSCQLSFYSFERNRLIGNWRTYSQSGLSKFQGLIMRCYFGLFFREWLKCSGVIAEPEREGDSRGQINTLEINKQTRCDNWKLLISAEGSKLRANGITSASRRVRLSQHRSMALQKLSWVKGFLTHTCTRTQLPTPTPPNRRRCGSFARRFSAAAVIRRPPTESNDCSCVNAAAAGCVCLFVRLILMAFYQPLRQRACACLITARR